MKYLYITDDKELLQSNIEPTEDEKESLAEGNLTVIKFENGQFYEATVEEITKEDEDGNEEGTGDYEIEWAPV